MACYAACGRLINRESIFVGEWRAVPAAETALRRGALTRRSRRADGLAAWADVVRLRTTRSKHRQVPRAEHVEVM